MKKLVSVFLLGSLLLFGCKSTVEPSTTDNAEAFYYSNDIYRFALDFPVTWGEVSVEKENIQTFAIQPIVSNYHFASKADQRRSLNLLVVNAENMNEPTIVDAPMTLVKSNQNWAIYWQSDASYAGLPGMEDPIYKDILSEIDEISASFEFTEEITGDHDLGAPEDLDLPTDVDTSDLDPYQ